MKFDYLLLKLRKLICSPGYADFIYLAVQGTWYLE